MYQVDGLEIEVRETPLGHYRVLIFHGDEELFRSLPTDGKTADDLAAKLDRIECSDCGHLAEYVTDFHYVDGHIVPTAMCTLDSR